MNKTTLDLMAFGKALSSADKNSKIRPAELLLPGADLPHFELRLYAEIKADVPRVVTLYKTLPFMGELATEARAVTIDGDFTTVLKELEDLQKVDALVDVIVVGSTLALSGTLGSRPDLDPKTELTVSPATNPWVFPETLESYDEELDVWYDDTILMFKSISLPEYRASVELRLDDIDALNAVRRAIDGANAKIVKAKPKPAKPKKETPAMAPNTIPPATTPATTVTQVEEVTATTVVTPAPEPAAEAKKPASPKVRRSPEQIRQDKITESVEFLAENWACEDVSTPLKDFCIRILENHNIKVVEPVPCKAAGTLQDTLVEAVCSLERVSAALSSLKLDGLMTRQQFVDQITASMLGDK